MLTDITKPKVSILLSTYNSEKYLRSQIDSLLNQTYPHWTLLIRDDGSKDSTLEIIQSYQDPRFKIIETGTNLGTILSFSKLLEYDDSDYFFFCDHDDIWNPNKVERQLQRIQSLEKQYGSQIPILVHSDLTIINDDNMTICDSMWKFGKFNPKRKKLSQLLVQGFVTGCTMVGNQKLREMITPIPKGVIMHDWWASIIACAFGKIDSDLIPTLKYRVHTQNQIGVQKPSIFQTLERFKKPEKFMKFFWESFTQAEEMLKRYSSQLSNPDKRTLETYCNLLKQNRITRILSALQFGFFRSTIYRNGLYYLVLFRTKRR